MPENGTPIPSTQATGTLVNFSIPTASASSSIAFYGALFGWKFHQMTKSYWLIEGGIGSLSLEREPVRGTMPILYFSVDEIEDAIRRALNLGAKIILNKTDVGDGKSFFATIQDLDGNIIGLWAKK